jgi:phage gp36-like protein
MFLTTNDYKPQIQDAILQSVLGGAISGNTTLASAELATQSEMESYLRARYDVVNIFNKTGTARNELIVMYMIDMVLYHLHSRINPNKVPDLRGIRYEAAISWLKSVAKGEISPDLPLLEDTEGNAINIIAYGSNPKRNLYY